MAIFNEVDARRYERLEKKYSANNWRKLEEDPNIPLKDLLDIVGLSDDIEVYQAIIENEAASGEVLEFIYAKLRVEDIGEIPNEVISMYYDIAEHPNLPDDMREKMISGEDLFLAHAAATNSKTPIDRVYDVLERLEKDDEYLEFEDLAEGLREVIEERGYDPDSRPQTKNGPSTESCQLSLFPEKSFKPCGKENV